jgi:hypothetical protein
VVAGAILAVAVIGKNIPDGRLPFSEVLAAKENEVSNSKNEQNLDFSDLDLGGIDQLEIDIMTVSESAAVPEGAASGGTWSCGSSRYSCSCSYLRN